MPPKKDPDTTPGVKLLRMFRKLMLDGRRHYQLDLAEEFQCSPQTIIRLAAEIESVLGVSFESGLDQRRRWYAIRSTKNKSLGLDFEELRYLNVCRDMAASTLPSQILERVDSTILNLATLMADQGYCRGGKKSCFAFYPKGHIDYTPHHSSIEKLVAAAEKRLVCHVQYRAAGKKESRDHRFAPGRIVAMSGALYVLGAKVDKDYSTFMCPTNFAVHRILDVAVTDKRISFEMPEFDPGSFGLPWHEPRTFRIQFSPAVSDYIRERVWADGQSFVDMKNGGVRLEITTRSEPELMAWVRSFGGLVCVIEPGKNVDE